MNLLRCVWYLGPNKGWRYWRITALCRRRPDFALWWAAALDGEALSNEANGVTKYAPAFRAFAADIRRNHATWTLAQTRLRLQSQIRRDCGH